MDTVASADGTVIEFDRYGDGPPVIMTVGAFNTRSQTEPLARALAPRFTALNYDRRGRGDSGDTAPYSVEREIADIAALIEQAGGSASLFGHSSGATLALRAAASGRDQRGDVLDLTLDSVRCCVAAVPPAPPVVVQHGEPQCQRSCQQLGL